MTRVIRGSDRSPARVVLASDRGLQFSDDYLEGWKWGFTTIGCEVVEIDIQRLRRYGSAGSVPSILSMRGTDPKELARQVSAHKPDLIFCHHGRAASNPAFLKIVRSAGIPTAVYLCDEPYESGATALYSPEFDYVFTMDPCTVEAHRLSRANRANVFYLPPGVQTQHFNWRSYENRSTPAFFLGNASLIPRPAWLAPIERMVDGARILYKRSIFKGRNTDQWIPYSKHPQLYGDAVVGLNVHRSPTITRECYVRRVKNRDPRMRVPHGIKLCSSMPKHEGTGFWNEGNLPAAHVNPRFLEMAACGTLVVSDDHRSELARMFPCAPRAQDPDHFLELVLHYLEHQDEAAEIGRICSYLISRRHSYRHRAAEVLIRVGLRGKLKDEMFSSLGEPEVWLSPQDLNSPEASSSSERTGPSERWSPRSGLSWIETFGRRSEAGSLDAPAPWLL